MALTRRQICRSIGVGAALLSGSTVIGAASAATRRDGDPPVSAARSPHPYSLDYWRGVVGSTLATMDNPHLNLKVVSVRDLRHIANKSRLRGSGDVFTLLLRDTDGHRIAEGIVAFHPSGVNRFDLHIRPTEPGSDYQAVINGWLPTR
ncbi:DUF6916 family protein [Actinacidiphila oryziradicis]|uniref:DUF6916 domain-containing protein n=1 Tax=Actinacidiphila oryziradicis TaxID=2571141 RepID=A0A4U0SL21_9ACTN|nr:hypothetical protein [Actinacidiphila oryziradicis]TKA10336.1 hypothetical protein FCI23_18090 [Actinacidiphila oryziradicis]